MSYPRIRKKILHVLGNFACVLLFRLLPNCLHTFAFFCRHDCRRKDKYFFHRHRSQKSHGSCNSFIVYDNCFRDGGNNGEIKSLCPLVSMDPEKEYLKRGVKNKRTAIFFAV